MYYTQFINFRTTQRELISIPVTNYQALLKTEYMFSLLISEPLGTTQHIAK